MKVDRFLLDASNIANTSGVMSMLVCPGSSTLNRAPSRIMRVIRWAGVVRTGMVLVGVVVAGAGLEPAEARV